MKTITAHAFLRLTLLCGSFPKLPRCTLSACTPLCGLLPVFINEQPCCRGHLRLGHGGEPE